jgi:hypothetical protein
MWLRARKPRKEKVAGFLTNAAKQDRRKVEEGRQSTPIESAILTAIYGIRSRGLESLERMTLLLGPDEYSQLRDESGHEVEQFFGFRVLVTATPGIALAWPPDRAEMARKAGKVPAITVRGEPR